jgi:hypothetical protein
MTAKNILIITIFIIFTRASAASVHDYLPNSRRELRAMCVCVCVCVCVLSYCHYVASCLINIDILEKHSQHGSGQGRFNTSPQLCQQIT